MINSITEYCYWSELQHVVISVVVVFCHVKALVVLHPIDHVIGSSDFTGESEVVIVYWNCVVSDHH